MTYYKDRRTKGSFSQFLFEWNGTERTALDASIDKWESILQAIEDHPDSPCPLCVVRDQHFRSGDHEFICPIRFDGPCDGTCIRAWKDIKDAIEHFIDILKGARRP